MTFSSASNSESSPAFRALSAIRCLRASMLAYEVTHDSIDVRLATTQQGKSGRKGEKHVITTYVCSELLCLSHILALLVEVKLPTRPRLCGDPSILFRRRGSSSGEVRVDSSCRIGRGRRRSGGGKTRGRGVSSVGLMRETGNVHVSNLLC
jgi:hypothetical protein